MPVANPYSSKTKAIETQRHRENREYRKPQLQRWTVVFCWVVPDKQVRTGNITIKHYSDLPVLQVEQVKMGCFEAIYEENVWKLKSTSNDQIGKFAVEFLFLKWSQNAICTRKGITGLFLTADCKDIQPILLQF